MRPDGYTIIVQKNGALASRQFRVASWVVRAVVIAGIVIGVSVAVILALYGPILAAAAREPLLQRRVAQLTRENARVDQLARALNDAETRYALLRGMLGAKIPPVQQDSGHLPSGAENLYVAPPILARAPAAADSGEPTSPSIPYRWPLSVPSYQTRGMISPAPSQEPHPGIDLAVPEGSSVRAAGGGWVESTGNDSSYGMFVLLRHPAGYESMYGHLSRVLVSRGDEVRAGQVIALSGNTGRSTAPHLHFEVRHNGRSIDPLTLVKEGK